MLKRDSICSTLVAVLLALTLGLHLPLAGATNLPPKKPEYPAGASSLSPGSELWREVRRRGAVNGAVYRTDDGILINDLWRELRQHNAMPVGSSQVEQVDSGVLINVLGKRWAQFRMTKLANYSQRALIVMFAIVILFFVVRGKVPVEGGLSGRMVKRFSDHERVLHWTLAIVFLFLAITGLILLLGRPLLLPLFGNELFALIASASKEGHNLFGPLFLVSLILMLISFGRRNLYAKGDLTWLLKGGGLIGKGHVSGGFFNMGEKTWYWIVILIGLVVSISGLILVSPNFGQGRLVMELSHVLHAIGGMVLIVISIGHMYLGSIGSEGALEAMTTGYVDINWADAHHDRWGKQCRQQRLILTADEYDRLQGRSGKTNAAEQAR